MQRSTLIPLAWIVFVVAWFIPVVDGGKTLHEGVLPGWEAFLVALRPDSDTWWGQALSELSALSNGLMVTSVIIAARRDRSGLPRWLAWLFFVSTGVNALWAWPSENGLRLRLGYWLWLGSFVLMSVAAFGRRRPRARDAAA